MVKDDTSNWKEVVTQDLLDNSVKDAVAFYGVEGAEAAIKRVYRAPSMKVIRDKYLETLYKAYGFGGKI